MERVGRSWQVRMYLWPVDLSLVTLGYPCPACRKRVRGAHGPQAIRRCASRRMPPITDANTCVRARIVAMAVVRMTRKRLSKCHRRGGAFASERACNPRARARANGNTFLRAVYQIPAAILARSGFMARVGNQLISLLISAPGRRLVALSRSFIVDYCAPLQLLLN